VEEREGATGKEACWLKIGAAWPHKDGKGFNLQLSALPASGGRIVLREFTDEDAAGENKNPVVQGKGAASPNKGRQGASAAKAR
jgi:hypothetical protein